MKENKTQEVLDDLHRDVYNAYTTQKMTIEEISRIMHLSADSIKQMIQTYQERIECGTVA